MRSLEDRTSVLVRPPDRQLTRNLRAWSLSTLGCLVLMSLLASVPAAAQTMLVGPTAYLSVSDVPAGFHASGSPSTLEDFEDCSLDFGIVASAGFAISMPTGGCVETSPNVDSVDADDGLIDGSGSQGNSWFGSSGLAGITFTFPAPVRSAGVVWTDGEGVTTFEAFGPGMVSLGTIGPVSLEDGQTSGSTAEDRFFGARDPGGVIALRVTNTVGGIELDHVQTGDPVASPVPIGPFGPAFLVAALCAVSLGRLSTRRRWIRTRQAGSPASIMRSPTTRSSRRS